VCPRTTRGQQLKADYSSFPGGRYEVQPEISVMVQCLGGEDLRSRDIEHVHEAQCGVV
jgi:hypothetical protein